MSRMDLVTPMERECLEAMKVAEKEFEKQFPEYGDVVKFRKGFLAGWKALHKEWKGW